MAATRKPKSGERAARVLPQAEHLMNARDVCQAIRMNLRAFEALIAAGDYPPPDLELAGQPRWRVASHNRWVAGDEIRVDQSHNHSTAWAASGRGFPLGSANRIAAQAARQAIESHIDDYRLYLIDKGGTTRHADHTAEALKRLFKNAGIARFSELRQEVVQRAIKGVRDSRSARTANHAARAVKAFLRWSRATDRIAELPGWLMLIRPYKEKADPRRSRRALSADQIARLIEAAKEGPPCFCYFHRSKKGTRAIQRADIRTMVRHACRSLIEAGIYPSVSVVKNRLGIATDTARKIRNDLLESEEVVIPAALAAGKHDPRPTRIEATKLVARPAISGPERAILYLVAISTGFRRGELASLTPEDFDLEARTITCRAAYTKNGDLAVQPIRRDVAERLRGWLTTQEPGRPVFLLPWHTAAMLRDDLERAGIEYETAEGVVDFHALRHSYISNLIEAGVDPKTVQVLARHSTITLTIDRYSHTDDKRKREAIERLNNVDRGERSGDL